MKFLIATKGTIEDLRKELLEKDIQFSLVTIHKSEDNILYSNVEFHDSNIFNIWMNETTENDIIPEYGYPNGSLIWWSTINETKD